MELFVKHYNELTRDELFEILALRASVFIVEQQCIYQDIEERDRQAWHVFLRDEAGLAAYLRVLDQANADGEVMLGRVIAVRRRCGLGTRIVQAGICVAREHCHARRILIHAQVYARPFYERLGFYPVSQEFLEDGIAHIRMLLNCP